MTLLLLALWMQTPVAANPEPLAAGDTKVTRVVPAGTIIPINLTRRISTNT